MPEGGQAGAPSEEALLSARNIKSWLAEFGRWLRPSSVLEYSDEVATDQASLLARLCLLAAVFATSTVALLAAEFHATIGAIALTGMAAIPVLYGVLLFCAREMMARAYTRVFLDRAVILLVFIGSAWGLLVFGVALNATPDHKDVIAAVMVGLLSTVNITVPFATAIAFFVPCGLACLLTLIVTFKPFDPYLFIFFAGYLSFAYFSTVLLNRFSLDRTVARLRLQHQHEVTSLFLKNYKESATDWTWEVDTNLRFRNISRRFATALRTLPEPLRRTPLRSLCQNADGKILDLGQLIEQFDQRRAFRDFVIQIDTGSEVRWWSFTGQPLYDANAHFCGYRGIASDITELRRSETRIRYLADHDSLTGLPNRACFVAQLEAACAGCNPSAGPVFALLLLDLDRFKEINDTHGHPVGDALLAAVAERLPRALRSGDSAFRLGGDEFAIILKIADPTEAAVAAARIIKTLEEPYVVHDATLRPGASIGLTYCPTDARDPAMLLRNADLALYKAKGAGRGAWRSYKPGMEAEQTEVVSLRNDLKIATEAEFQLEYQPILDLISGRVVAAEALVRWDHPTRGRVQPSVFIPIAEDSGLISALGGMVLNQACRTAADWPDHVRVSVNISALQIRDADFLPTVERALSSSGLPASRLELELTERVLLSQDELSFRTIDELHRRGVHVVLDDFGTGYSSLAALIRFHFGGVKIDAQFTTAMETDERARAIVRSISRIAEDLDLPVTAEGVEAASQLHLLSRLGISRAQGFLIGRPQTADELAGALREQSGQLVPGFAAMV